MAVSLSNSTLPFRELCFLRPESPRRIRITVPRTKSQNCASSRLLLHVRCRAVQEEEEVEVVKEEVNDFGFNGNGSSNGGYGYNGYVESANGSATVNMNGNGASNGSLVKYGEGNGSVMKVVEEVSVSESKSERKKSVEEIGQEEAWFKSSGKDKVEVSVAPGGRWNRFKTYSTIQRTLEIWGFVLIFIFKAWLNNQKFAYRGNKCKNDASLET